MPSPKSGTAGSAISPADPKAAEEADVADPGEVAKIKAEQRQMDTWTEEALLAVLKCGRSQSSHRRS